MINASTMVGGTITGTEINGVQINGGNINVNTAVTVGDSIEIGNPNSTGDKTIYFENRGNNTAWIKKYTNGNMNIWCDDKIVLSGYDGTQITGQVGFFGTEPITQQTATRLPDTATLADLIIKVNGILGKLENYGLLRITG